MTEELHDMFRAREARDLAEKNLLRQEAQAEIAPDLVGQYQDVDIAEQKRHGIPLDGTTSNRFARPGTRMVGRFDASTGEAVHDGHLEPDFVTQPVYDVPSNVDCGPGCHAMPGRTQFSEETMRLSDYAREAWNTSAGGVYNFGRSIWNFADDMSGGGGYRPPPAEDVGFGTETTVGSMTQELAPFIIGGVTSFTRLAGLSSMAARTAASGAVVEGVVADPREGGVTDVLGHWAGLEGNLVAKVAEDDPELARVLMAGEGGSMSMALTGLGRGGLWVLKQLAQQGSQSAHEAARVLWEQTDQMERQAIMNMTAVQHRPGEGAREDQQGPLTQWMTAKLLKGERTLSDQMAARMRAAGYSDAQIVSAWNVVARAYQEQNRVLLTGTEEENGDESEADD